jgi:DNA-directed RNA polymerase III subunit RPC2
MPVVDDGFEALLEPFYNGKKLTDPISTVGDKNQLLPAFLKVKGTVIWLPGGGPRCRRE